MTGGFCTRVQSEPRSSSTPPEVFGVLILAMGKIGDARYREKSCRNCGETFLPAAPAQVCCTPECRDEDRRRRRRAARALKKYGHVPEAVTAPEAVELRDVRLQWPVKPGSVSAADADKLPLTGLEKLVAVLGENPMWFDPNGEPIPGVHPLYRRDAVPA